ncbi:Sodium-coupled monocarboxylate transporter 1 [Papilio machaon]|uniref:Sodium-coupled monocarboxylate transporter 1 n=1 Tax=Papilio machaon TaxID=76193 RepID=A0A194R7Q9_PAPMA|nr:Sodium-coupled monocarboxylate transporter 1 [Papilio machaon]
MTEGGFGVGDFVAFGFLCLASCAGGLWYSAIGSRTKAVVDIRDYLLGGRAMSTFPVAMSLIASYVSGVTILGTPAEIYNYGSQYWLVVVGVSLSCVVVATVYLPVFCTLRLSSSYEYLELRFNRHVRAVASILFLLDEVLFLPMVIYVPALAFNQLTGFNVYAVGGVMVAICGLYTVLGGLRAVVWTDSVQTGIMFIGVMLVAAAGTIAVGGVRVILDVTGESGRLSISNWDLSPYVRQTGWGSVVGGFLYWTCFNSVNQTMVQRYIALPSKRKAIIALAIFCMGAILAISLCVWCGLAAWAAWVRGGCAPAGRPLVDDRLLPAFVTYVSRVQHLPGLAGVFLAGVFGAGVATALSAIAASSTCGMFTLGMACWWVGPRGAIAGAVAGAVVAATVSLGTQAAAAHGLREPPMDYAMQCPNATFQPPVYLDPEEVFPLFRISYHWIAPLGLVTTLCVGSVVGWLCDRRQGVPLDAELFTPAVWRLLPAEARDNAGVTRRNLASKAADTPPSAPLIVGQPSDKIEMNGESSR